MFKKNADGSVTYTRRFWVAVTITMLFISFIGWRTQNTSDRVDAQAARTEQIAQLNNACLNQLLDTLKERVEFNDQVSAVRTDRDQVWMQFFVDLAKINTDLPQQERDRQAAPIIAKFFSDNTALDQRRADILSNRNETPYPEENCGMPIPMK